MGGTWVTQNKKIPGVYINFRSNKPLAITPGDRGTVLMPLPLAIGTKGDIYIETVLNSEFKQVEEFTEDMYFLVSEALKEASKVLVYNLGESPEVGDYDTFLAKALLEDFNTLAYTGTDVSIKTKLITWIKTVRADEGKSVQLVLANATDPDHESVINVKNGVVLDTGKTLKPEEAVAWVAGATAGAGINQSLTNKKYSGAIDVVPRLSKSEKEAAIDAGEFAFTVNNSQRVTCLYDINSLTTFTPEKSNDFRKNRMMRVFDGINTDVVEVFEANYMGKVDNNGQGRSLFRSSLIEYFRELERLGAIQNFVPDDVTIKQGNDKDSVVADMWIQPVDSAEKFYFTVNVR